MEQENHMHLYLTGTKKGYNVYRVTTEHGVSRKMMGGTASQIRKDFEAALPGVKIERIELD